MKDIKDHEDKHKIDLTKIAYDLFSAFTPHFTQSLGWSNTFTLFPINPNCAGRILGMAEGVTGYGLLMNNSCREESSRGKPVLGIAVVNNQIEILQFPAGECPWLIHEKSEPQWPKGYKEYGAFGYDNITYVHEDFLSYMEKVRWAGCIYGESTSRPTPQYYIAYGGASFESFTECLPKYIKTKDFTKDTS